jgi:hypothetical protein
MRAIAFEQPAERNSGGWSMMGREFEKYEFLLVPERKVIGSPAVN